jgi:gamma-glutamylcyclotransferase (GGCT)/AIG2-like uncharacterized protein YtfP
MEDYIKRIYDHYTKATDFRQYWFVFENYLDSCFPHEGRDDSFRKRAHRFEKHLKEMLVHETFLRQLHSLPEARELAELKPRIFREINQDTSAHDAFAKDYSRFERGEKPKAPIARLINLAYTVRCNAEHGQKVLPDEWEGMRRRNEQIFSLTTPLVSRLAELVVTQFVVLGVFSYGTLQEASDADFGFAIARKEGMRIRGRLYDMGRFPAWRYNTWERVQGCVLRAEASCRLEHVKLCDDAEGNQFERRLELAYDKTDKPQHLVWAYHFTSEPDFKTKIKDGIWRGCNNSDAGDGK